MKELEVSARTVEEAIQLALEQLGIGREQVEVDIVKEGKTGVLGLGSEEAVVRVRPLPSESNESDIEKDSNKDHVADMAKSILEELLDAMSISATVEYRQGPVVDEEGAEIPITLNIMGEDLGILIGRRGQTLACLQYIVRLIITHKMRAQTTIVIDVEGYKQRRYQALKDLALRIAEQVESRGIPFTLEPMPAYERRIIHITLAEHPSVATESTGVGEVRKVVILPKPRK